VYPQEAFLLLFPHLPTEGCRYFPESSARRHDRQVMHFQEIS